MIMLIHYSKRIFNPSRYTGIKFNINAVMIINGNG